MHKWYKAVLMAMVTGLLIGAAAPAHAAQVPFNFYLPIPGTGAIGISPMNNDTGFVGYCDPVRQCTGMSVRVANTYGEVEVGGVTIDLAGAICVQDRTAPCGRSTSAGTGVVFTRQSIALGTTGATVPDFELEYCVWEMDPRFAPGSCTTVYVPTATLGLDTKTEADLGQYLPDRVVVEAILQG